MVSTEHFRRAIRSRLEVASALGGKNLTIDCEELYRSVSRLPVSNRGMIFCCNAMRAEMAIPDEIIFDHVKETLLKVKYKLPRENQAAICPRARTGTTSITIAGHSRRQRQETE